MSIPRISVAMSVYNGERFLADAIESILAQSFTDFEFLILDDGSTDSSPAIIAGYAAQDPRIRPIMRENRGLIVSLNQLLDEARAPIIARMDADDICMPQRFERQIAFLDAHPDYGVIGAWTDDMDENGGHYQSTGPHHPTDHASFLEAIDRWEPLLCHPVVTYRRDVVRGVGGYHAAFRHCEDMDLWLRLASVTKLCNLPEPLIRYRHYAGQVSARHSTEQQIGATVSMLAYYRRKAGQPDPTETLERLPAIDELDTLFAQPGTAKAVRARVASAILYSAASLRGDGFDLLLQHVREGGQRDGMWRAVIRLARLAEPVRALRLAAALIGAH